VAASIALAAWCNAIILAWRGGRTFGFSIDAQARKRLPRIVLAALLMAGMLWYAEYFVASAVLNAGLGAQVTILGGLVAAAIAFYGLLLDLFGIVSWGEAISDLRG